MEGFAKIWQHIPVWLKSISSNAYYTQKKKSSKVHPRTGHKDPEGE